MSGFEFKAKLETEKAPKTCEAFEKLLPIENKIIHVRWSGSAVWIPSEEYHFGDLPIENGTSHPAKGEILFYPGYLNEKEIFIPYGGACFSSQVGQLPGSQFLTITEGLENIEEVGRRVLWEGAQDITIEKI
jgi:hypothetical protein